MNQQTNMADAAATDLVRQIATKLYGAAGAEVTDLISLANRVQADVGNPASPSPAGQGDARTALIEEAIGCLNLIAVQPPLVDQARRALVRALAARQPVAQEPRAVELTCDHGGWKMEPWDAFGLPTVGKKVTVYAAPPAQTVGPGKLREIARSLSHSAKVDDYEPQQIAFIESVRERLNALIDSQAVSNG